MSDAVFDRIVEEIPPAIWMHGEPLPSVYHGRPVDMVRQMCGQAGEGITIQRAVEFLSVALNGRMRPLHFIGNPPDEVRAGLFVFALLRNGICQPMARA